MRAILLNFLYLTCKVKTMDEWHLGKKGIQSALSGKLSL